MANLKISQLSNYTDAVNKNIVFVNNDSGETATTKIKLNDFNGLTNGTGTNTVKSNNYLTSSPSSANTTSAIAIGNGAEATGDYSIAIGNEAYNVNRDNRVEYILIGKSTRGAQYTTVIGSDANCESGAYGDAIGKSAAAQSDYSIAIGNSSFVSYTQTSESVAIGYDTTVNNNAKKSVVIGSLSQADSANTVAIGYDAETDGYGSVAIGDVARTNGSFGITIGGSGHTNNGDYNTIIGGVNNVTTSYTGATMLNTKSRSADQNDTTFVENLKTFGNAEVQGQSWVTLPTTGTTTSSTTINWNDGNVQEKVLGDNTTFTFSNGNAGATYILVVKQSAGGSNTITWPGSVTWAGASTPTMTSTANRYDVYTFIYDGNKYFGSYIQNFI
jgi:hypothetical protein